MGRSRGTTIALRPHPDQPARKVTKIVPLGDGGFAMLAPYHAARAGYLAKVPVDYRKVGDFPVPKSELIGFTVEDQVKLSYHEDGFVQFSGADQGRIISGRDPETGLPKGLGLMCQPIADPVRTGPSVGITVWGLQDFDELEGSRDSSVVFGPEGVYHRGCDPDTANGWVIEFFLFPSRFWAGVRQLGDKYVLSMAFLGFEASGAVIDLTVIPLPGQPSFLAAFASRFAHGFSAASGWVLDGPGERGPDGSGHVLMGMYPREEGMGAGAPSLDYVALVPLARMPEPRVEVLVPTDNQATRFQHLRRRLIPLGVRSTLRSSWRWVDGVSRGRSRPRE